MSHYIYQVYACYEGSVGQVSVYSQEDISLNFMQQFPVYYDNNDRNQLCFLILSHESGCAVSNILEILDIFITFFKRDVIKRYV